MRKVVSVLLLVLMLVAVVGCSGNNNEEPVNPGADDLPEQLQAIVNRGKLLVGTKVDVPGFGYQNPETGDVEGLEIDIAKALAKKLLGDETLLETQGVTAQTRGPLLDNNEVDLVIATFTITEERKLSFNFTEPYFTDAIGFLVKKDLGATVIEDLDGLTIGVAQSATTKDALEERAAEVGVTFKYAEFASYPEINAALASGRVDAFSVDKSILSGYVNETTVILEEGFKPQDYGIACKLDNKDLAEYVQEFIVEIKADGTLDSMLAKWNLN